MVNAMTSYAEDRARYDSTYIRDVYESVEAASSQFKLPSNATWPGVATALRGIRACLSIDANSTCKITPDARDAFGTYASKLGLQVAMASDVVEAFSSEAHAYQQRVEGAFDIPNVVTKRGRSIQILSTAPPYQSATSPAAAPRSRCCGQLHNTAPAAPSGGSTRRSCDWAPPSLFSSSSKFRERGSLMGSVG